MSQLLLFDPAHLPSVHQELLSHYIKKGGLSMSNSELYDAQSATLGMDVNEFTARVPVGKRGDCHSTHTRAIRWHQQTLKAKGWLEPVPNIRGRWRLSEPARKALTAQEPRRVMLGYSTNLGVALWASCEDVFTQFDEPITLALTSPPYALSSPRAYGNVPLAKYVDWLCQMLEPIIKNLRTGGCIALNISNDIFEKGSPARSTYRERLVIALCDRYGLEKLDELIWHNPCKAPGPIQWASLQRQQLNTAWEPVYVFTNNAKCCVADNRRVLQEHTKKHLDLIAQGGEKRTTCASDGAYRLKHGSFGKATPGKIPKNLLTFAHSAADPALQAAKEDARADNLPTHGAPMPLALADFLVRYLSEEGDLVVDPFGGWGTTGYAAEQNSRRWVTTEKYLEYVVGSSRRFIKP